MLSEEELDQVWRETDRFFKKEFKEIRFFMHAWGFCGAFNLAVSITFPNWVNPLIFLWSCYWFYWDFKQSHSIVRQWKESYQIYKQMKQNCQQNRGN